MLVSAPSIVPSRAACARDFEFIHSLLLAERKVPAAFARERLSAYVVAQASLLPWRAEAFSWLAACEPLLTGKTLIEPRWRALWWRHIAGQTFLFAGQLAEERARRAAAVCRAADEPLHLAYSLIYLSGALGEQNEASDVALEEVQALLDVHPDWLTELRVLFLNAKAKSCIGRGDLDTSTTVLRRALDMAVAARLHTATRYTAMTLPMCCAAPIDARRCW